MASTIADFYRGDTKTYAFNFGTGLDITGWKIYLTFKENADDDDSSAIVQVSNTAGDNASDDIANGLMYVTLSSLESAKFEPNIKYYYGFQRIVAGSPPDIKTLLTGKVKVLQDITLATV